MTPGRIGRARRIEPVGPGQSPGSSISIVYPAGSASSSERIRTELPGAVDALIQRRPQRGIEERLIDAQHAVEIGRSKHRNAPVGHGPLSWESGAIELARRCPPIHARFRPRRDVDYTVLW